MHKKDFLRHLGIALIVVALGAAQSARASALSDAAEALQPGQWMEFNTQGFGGSLLDACNNINTILEWSNKATWNPVDREVHFVGEGHTSCAKHIRYQESSNSWTTLAIPDGIQVFGHAYEHNTVNPRNGDFYWRNYNSDQIEKYNRLSNSWSALPPIGTSTQVAGAIEYFPEADGILYVDGDFGVYFYSSVSNSWSLIANTAINVDSSKPTISMAAYHNFASYNPIDKVVYFGGGNNSAATYKFDANRNVTQVADSPTSIGINNALTVPDPASGVQLIFANSGSLFEYNTATDSWSGAGSHPVMSYARDWRVAIPISTYGVTMFLTWDFDNSKVLLYRHSPGTLPPPPPRPMEPTNFSAN